MKKLNHRKYRPSANQNAAQMTPKIISDMKQNNYALTMDFQAPPYGLAPYANPADKLYGAKGAITQALRKCHAVFESGVENTWQRSKAIGASLFVKEIVQLVNTIAGEKTYSVYMIRNCLHIWMPEDGAVGVIKLSNDEDKPRPCPRPRHKFYLIAEGKRKQTTIKQTMKIKNTNYQKLIQNENHRKLASDEALEFDEVWNDFFVDDVPSCKNEINISSFTFIKLYRRGENCEIPDGCDYLIVVSHEMDGGGEWLPNYVQSFRSLCELKKALRKMAESSEQIVVKSSGWFERVVSGLGLRHLTSEWGRL